MANITFIEGPQGYNGTMGVIGAQGPDGPPGSAGSNFSLCFYDTASSNGNHASSGETLDVIARSKKQVRGCSYEPVSLAGSVCTRLESHDVFSARAKNSYMKSMHFSIKFFYIQLTPINSNLQGTEENSST